MNALNRKRVIAIYLPQFHPFKENDEWWGKGFTEWTNVTKARPRFPGHYQPHLPSDLGFYDLRLPEVRDEQAKMAKEVGIYGFCYYHYWFNGKLLMERPLKEILDSGKPDFPFMMCWANENWTRAWDGGEKHILIEQSYTDDDAREHIKWMLPYLQDQRYIRVKGKPVICIYRTTIIPNLENMIDIWRNEAAKVGLDLYICRFESFGVSGEEYLTKGIDAAVEFQPFTKTLSNYHKKFHLRTWDYIRRHVLRGYVPKMVNYEKYIKCVNSLGMPKYKRYPCVTPMWDNTSRRKKNAFMLTHTSPVLYGEWLKSVILNFKPYSEDENFVFINAWNEWAEGNHLEPCVKWGDEYLNVTRKVLGTYNE